MVDDGSSCIAIGRLLLGRLGTAVQEITPPISMAYRYQPEMHGIGNELLFAKFHINPTRIFKLQTFVRVL
jgi:hypothetical protein